MRRIKAQWVQINYVQLCLLKIIHLMRDGSGKVACLESNHFVGSSPTGGDIFF